VIYCHCIRMSVLEFIERPSYTLSTHPNSMLCFYSFLYYLGLVFCWCWVLPSRVVVGRCVVITELLVAVACFSIAVNLYTLNNLVKAFDHVSWKFFTFLGCRYIAMGGLTFLHCFFLIFFFIFQFFCITRHQTKTKIGDKDSLYLEGIEAKFQLDCWGVLEGGAFFHIYNQQLDESAAVDQDLWYVLNPHITYACRLV